MNVARSVSSPVFVVWKQCIDYIENPDKTEEMLYISSYMCDTVNTTKDFAEIARLARHGGNTLAHHIIRLIDNTLNQGIPPYVALNVNIPRLPIDEIKGIRICRQAYARWSDSFEKRIDPQGRPYWWLTGKFDCPAPTQDSDEWALTHGYARTRPESTG